MALKDYNGIAFKNTAIDKMSGSFGKGPGDGVKKSSAAASTTTLANPWTKPTMQAVTAPAIKKPASTPMPAAKPSTNVSTVADKGNASAPAAKTLRDVKAENKIKKAEAKGTAAVQKINQRASMTPEQKTEKRQKAGANFGKAVERTLEVAGSALGVYGTYKGLKNN